jgi:hypothetical protein
MCYIDGQKNKYSVYKQIITIITIATKTSVTRVFTKNAEQFFTAVSRFKALSMLQQRFAALQQSTSIRIISHFHLLLSVNRNSVQSGGN